MRVVIAPDSFKGTLTARDAAAAIAEGWADVRPDDELTLRPMSDGGDGLLEVVGDRHGRPVEVEVADARGLPRAGRFRLRGESALIESAEACGLVHVPVDQRDPLRTTTYGVGQLLVAARAAGATRMLVGLGGSATVDGGSGALAAIGFRVSTDDGGLKIGGEQLERVAAIEPRWAGDWERIEVDLLADVRTVLLDAPRRFGPQKGAAPGDVPLLERGLRRWADVVERDLGVALRDRPGAGAAGGLGFGLAAGVGGRLVPGAQRVAELIRLPDELDRADLVLLGEGELDETSDDGKVVGAVLELAAERDVTALAVVGRQASPAPRLERVEESSPDTPTPGDARGGVVAAARRLARTVG